MFARPNLYETGRGHLVIDNWSRLPAVSVDLAAVGLRAGDRFKIRDVQNYFGSPVVSGTFAGNSVSIPMTGTVVSQPVGNAPLAAVHTDSEFGTFVVRKTTTTSTESLEATLIASPSSVTVGEFASLTWTTTGATTVSLDQGIDNLSWRLGSVNPSVTRTYTLTASNASATTTRTAMSPSAPTLCRVSG